MSNNPFIDQLQFRHPNSTKIFKTFETLYDNNFDIEPSEKPKIPKIIHQFWFGGKPIPPLYQVYRQTCKNLHPTWDFRLWKEKDIADYGIV